MRVPSSVFQTSENKIQFRSITNLANLLVAHLTQLENNKKKRVLGLSELYCKASDCVGLI